MFEKIKDIRAVKQKVSLADALMSAFAMFPLDDPSLLAFEERIATDTRTWNICIGTYLDFSKFEFFNICETKSFWQGMLMVAQYRKVHKLFPKFPVNHTVEKVCRKTLG